MLRPGGVRARSRSASTCCCASSAPTATTSRSSSTSTAACRAWSRSRTCSSRSSATSRTSTTSTRARTTSSPRRNGRFRVKAQTEIADFNAQFGTALRRRGLRHRRRPRAAARSGACPSAARPSSIDGFRFRVLRADSRRVHTLQVERVAPAAQPAATPDRGRRASARPRLTATATDDRAAPSRPCTRFALVAGALCVLGFAPFALPLCRSLHARRAVLAVARGAARARRRADGLRVRRSASSAPARRGSTSRCETFGGMPAPLARHRHRGLLRLPRAVARAGRLGRRARRAPAVARRALRRSRRVDARRMAARHRLHRLPLADARLLAAAGQPARGLRAARRRVPGVARRRVLRGAARRWRSTRCRARRARRGARPPRRRSRRLFVAGASRWRIEWTQPDGAPVAVSLVQGNVPQEVKFDPELRERNVPALRAARRAEPRPPDRAARERAAGVRDQVPAGAISSASAARRDARNGDVLLGLFTRRAADCPGDEPRITTASCRLGAGALAGLPQAPPGAVRRDDSAEAAVRLADQQRADDPARRPDARARRRSRRSPSPGSRSPSTSATRTRSATSCGAARAPRRCSST